MKIIKDNLALIAQKCSDSLKDHAITEDQKENFESILSLAAEAGEQCVFTEATLAALPE